MREEGKRERERERERERVTPTVDQWDRIGGEMQRRPELRRQEPTSYNFNAYTLISESLKRKKNSLL